MKRIIRNCTLAAFLITPLASRAPLADPVLWYQNPANVQFLIIRFILFDIVN